MGRVFSIVVPTYNRPRQIENFLQCLSALDYDPQKFEVIIVDDGSEIPLKPFVDAFPSRFHITCIRQTNAGPSNARHMGTLRARGKILAFTDDDCLPERNWLLALESACLSNPNCAVGGQTINCLDKNLYAAATQLMITYLYEYYNRDWSNARYFTTSNLAFPAHLYQKMGGLDPDWNIYGGEDRDLCDRWLRSGNRIVYAPEVSVYHAHQMTMSSFFRQHFNYGRGGFQFHFGRKKEPLRKFPLNPLSFYIRLLIFPFSCLPLPRAVKICILLLLSQLALALGFAFQFRLCWRQRAKNQCNNRTNEAA